MKDTIQLGRYPARTLLLTALFLGLTSCSTSDTPTESETTQPVDAPSQVIAYAGGIPFGLYHVPILQLGAIYNGTLQNGPDLAKAGTFLTTLAAIKARGGKVFLELTGNEDHFVDSQGHFSFTKWKQRVDVFRAYNFSSYIKDGTIIAHFLIDEPNDPTNFGGQAVPGTMVEAMAKYSKSIWPTMATVTRTESTYLAQWPSYTYLDATWAQYVYRKGDPGTFIRRNVADAQKIGLALVTGLNIKRGGPQGATMTPAQIKSWGSTLLSNSYPCAFVSWEWVPDYFSIAGVRDAMTYLRGKAQNRAFKSCRS
jgi:hypothetical protein